MPLRNLSLISGMRRLRLRNKGGQMNKYKVSVRMENGCIIREFEAEGLTLEDALKNLCNECIETDDTGIFFELENADLDYFKNDPHFHIVKVDGIDYGIVLEDLEVSIPGRNRYLSALRAKREMLGLSAPKMAEMAWEPHYEDKEAGNIEMSLSQYVRFMQVLENLENGF